MATNAESPDDSNERRTRHPAVRVFASEFRDATYQFKTEDSDRAPKYTLLPTGVRANRFFIVGVLTEDNLRLQENDGGEFVNARIHDGDDYFYVSASSRFQPDEANALREMDLPARVGIVGKASHWETDDGDHRVEITPESVVNVSEDDRYAWIMDTAAATRDRIAAYQEVTDEELDDGTAPADVSMAHTQYEDNPSMYLDTCESVLREMFLTDE